MTLTIDFPGSIEKRLEEMSASGTDVSKFVREAVEAKLASENARRLFECLKPIHDETERLGLTESDVEAMVDEAIAQVRAEKRTRTAT